MKELQSDGFTMIELIVVIVILGILAAFALPRFAELDKEAHETSVRGTGSAFKSGVVIAHSVWAAKGVSGPIDNLMVFEGGTDGRLDMNSNGWPAQNYAPFESDPQLNNVNDCLSIWPTLLQEGSASASNGTSTDYQAVYLGSNRCDFRYNGYQNMSIFYDSQTGEVTIDSNSSI